MRLLDDPFRARQFRRAKMVVVDPTPKIHDWWYPHPDTEFYDAP